MRGWLWILALVAVIGGGVLYMNRAAFKKATSLALSQEGIDAIKRHEGWRASVYKDAVGLPTIGYGHLIKAGEKFATITLAQGEEILRKDLETAEAIVRRYVTVPLTQGMYDALVSLVFNVGQGAKGVKDGIIFLKSGEHSTLFKLLQAGDYVGAAAQILRWNKAGGQEVAGLTTRRTDENKTFLRGFA